jgi:hypothetical protein
MTKNSCREENMPGISKFTRLLVLSLLILLPLGLPSHAQSSGRIRIEVVSGGFIIGGSGGSGTLTVGSKSYPLSIGGLSLGVTIGLARARLHGQVYNLRNVRDIEGTYSAMDAGYAFVGGRKTARLRNSRGVILELRGRQVGIEATLDVSGIQISLK